MAKLFTCLGGPIQLGQSIAVSQFMMSLYDIIIESLKVNTLRHSNSILKKNNTSSWRIPHYKPQPLTLYIIQTSSQILESALAFKSNWTIPMCPALET